MIIVAIIRLPLVRELMQLNIIVIDTDIVMRKYKYFEICDGDYLDVTGITSWKEALECYRKSSTPKSIFGVTKDNVSIPIYAKQ